jgi:spore germination protein KB
MEAENMIGKEKIEYRQLAILVLMFTIGTSIIIAPSMVASHAEQDGWISALLGSAVGIIFVWCYASMGKYFKGQSLVEIIFVTFGNYLGFVVALLFVGFCITLSSLVLSNLGNFVSTRVLVGTPINAIEFIFVVVVVIAVRLGIETIARSAEFLIPLFTFLFLILIFAVLPQLQIENIRPVFEHSTHEILQSSYGIITFPFGELLLFLMLTPLISKSQKITRGFVIGSFIGAMVIILITLVSILSLGGMGTATNTYPAFAIAKKIDIGGVMQRIEVIMAGIWMFSIFFKLSLCVYVTALSMKQLFRLKDINCLTFPITISLIPLSQWFSPNASDFQTFTQKWMMVVTFAVMCIPFITTGLLFIKRKWKRKREEDGGRAEGTTN